MIWSCRISKQTDDHPLTDSRRLWKRCGILLPVLLLYGISNASENSSISVHSTVDNASPTIGEIFHYRVVISRDPSIELAAVPDWGANLGEFEIKDFEIIPPLERSARIEEGRIFTLTTFTSGDYVIPPFSVEYRDEEGTLQEVSAEQIFVHIRSIGERESDMEDIRDLKGLASFPRPIWPYITLGGFLCAVAAGVLSYSACRKKGKGRTEMEPVKPSRPPHEIALETLEALRKKPLETPLQRQFYYFALSEIVRAYIQSRYGVPALEETTEELLDEIKGDHGEHQVDIPLSLLEPMETFLRYSDLVKFAKLLPPNETIEDQTGIVERFIRETAAVRPVPEEAGGLPGDKDRSDIF
jgi:hypothetical protein